MDIEIKNFRPRFEWKFRKAVGLGSSALQKVLSSVQEVGNLPTRVISYLTTVLVLVRPVGLF